MQPIPCSETRVIVFDAYNPRDLADEVNLWLKCEGEVMEVTDWSYRMVVDHNHERNGHAIHSMSLLCRKIETKS